MLQLLHMAHAARTAATDDHWRALARILDEHTLRWLPAFAARVAARTSASFHAALAVLTATWTDMLRELVSAHLNEPRPAAEDLEARTPAASEPEPAPLAYLPVQGPSW